MKRMIFKNCLREIKDSFGRFFAIFAIVLIGVAFFAGVTATAPDMKHSSDQYYDAYNLMDIRLLSNIGFTEDDIRQAERLEQLEGLFASYNMDAVAVTNGQQNTIRIMGLPDTGADEQNVDYINRLRIKEGRLPEREGECVVVHNKSKGGTVAIGDKLVLDTGDDGKITDKLKNEQYEVVGIVYTPYYLSFDMGQSEVGNGRISYCIFMRNSEFISEYYTEVFATVRDTKALDTYSKGYFDKVGKAKDALEALAAERVAARIQEIRDTVKEEKEKTLQEAREHIAKTIREQIEKQYQIYYPGQDMSAITEPMIQEAVTKALAEFDSTEIDSEFAKAETEALKGSEDWKWYLLDRDSHFSFRDYESSADKIKAIATVFPVFFLIVAALVCLTTMTRMVDEQRELIGTFKALGYNRFDITMKYVLYSLIASLSGGVIGCLLGLKMFPTIIYDCWNILYDMPDIVYADHTVLSIIAVGLMTLVILLSTVYACNSDLAEVPATLMRPKAPGKGKKILLEHIGFLWKRLSFSNKVTARNIFRYKKRFFMTVIGIAGGGALMMAGFGIKDSISALIQKQFGELTKYDVSIVYKGTDVEDLVKSDEALTNSTTVYYYIADVANAEYVEEPKKQVKEDVVVNVVREKEHFQEFVLFRKRNTNTVYDFTDDGIYVSEKTAKDLKVKAGDTVYLQSGDEVTKPVKVANVIEMYAGNYIYLSEAYYRKVFEEEYQDNCVYAMLKDTSHESESQFGTKYIEMDGVSAITFFSDNVSRFTDMISTIHFVTYILILSAAALSFVVLYNLTNVNISERIREIATIKVLGFYNSEVALYVYKENIVISIIGALAGLVLGIWLHDYIMQTLEMEDIMFGNVINGWSFVYSFMLTMLFSLFVNIFMYRKLKKIPMVESLKSVE